MHDPTQEPRQQAPDADDVPPPAPQARASQLPLQREFLFSLTEQPPSPTAPSKGQTTVLPDIIPGFKADPLEIPIPGKVKDTFRTGAYVPYTSLTHAARQKAARGETSVVLDIASGGFTVKGLDRQSEKSITEVDWIAAAKAAKGRVRHYHGNTRASALAAHHANVIGIARKNGWQVAMDYDVHQRDLAALNPQHNLSSVDAVALASINGENIRKLITAQLASLRQLPPHTQHNKRQAPSHWPSENPSPRKRPARSCFRCGSSGHVTDSCSASSTVANLPAASASRNSKGKPVLTAPDGKPYCFIWSKDSSCSFGTHCSNMHACSVCCSPDHGANHCSTRE